VAGLAGSRRPSRHPTTSSSGHWTWRDGGGVGRHLQDRQPHGAFVQRLEEAAEAGGEQDVLGEVEDQWDSRAVEEVLGRENRRLVGARKAEVEQGKRGGVVSVWGRRGTRLRCQNRSRRNRTVVDDVEVGDVRMKDSRP